MAYRPPRFLFRRYEILRSIGAGRRFLEVGAADLSLSIDLLDRFDEGLAIDLCDDLEESYARLPRELRARLAVRRVDVETVAREATNHAAFDAVVCCEVLEHVEDDRGFLRALRACLAPGGRLALSVPSRMKYWSRHDEVVGHLRRYEKHELKQLLEEAGFEAVDIRSYGFPWVNVLRIPRLLLAKRQERERASWSQREQTIRSNHQQIPERLASSRIGLIVNSFTVAPLAFLSRAFGSFDWSDGYVVLARASRVDHGEAPHTATRESAPRTSAAPIASTRTVVNA